jgi:hypothetical protein
VYLAYGECGAIAHLLKLRDTAYEALSNILQIVENLAAVLSGRLQLAIYLLHLRIVSFHSGVAGADARALVVVDG